MDTDTDYSKFSDLACANHMTFKFNVWFQKVSIFPHGQSLEIPKGRGVLKAKILEEKYEAKLEFPGG